MAEQIASWSVLLLELYLVAGLLFGIPFVLYADLQTYRRLAP